MKEPEEINEMTLHISNNTIIRVALFSALFYMLYYLSDLVIVLLVSIVIASSIEPIVKRLQKYKVPRAATALAILASVIGVFFWIVSMFIPIVIKEFSSFIDNIPSILQNTGYLLNMSPESTQVLKSVFGNPSNASEIIKNAQGVFKAVGGGLATSTGAFFHTVTNIVLIFVISFYLSVQERGIETFIRTLIPKKNEEYAIGLWARAQQKIAKWMQGQLVLGLIIGVLVYIGLTIMGVPYALLLAILAGLFELIPVFGPILAMVPAVLLSLSTGGVSLGVSVLVFYLIIQQIVILSLLIGAQVAGFWGILWAVPVVSVFMEYIEDVQKGKGIIE